MVFCYKLLRKLIIICLFFSAFSSTNHYLYSSGIDIIANVNGKNIFFNDIEDYRKINKIIQKIDTSKKEALKKIIQFNLIIQHAQSLNIFISNQDKNNYIKQVIKNLGLKNTSLPKYLKSKGISSKKINQFIEFNTYYNKMIQFMSYSRATVSEQEITSKINNLLSLNGKPKFLLYEVVVDNEEMANKIYQRIKKSKLKLTTFKKQASLHSIYLSHHNSGKIGWVNLNELSIEEQKILATMKPNSLSKVVETNDDFYKIYYVEDIQPVIYFDSNNSDQVKQLRSMIEQKIFYEKVESNIKNYLSTLEQNASITIYSKQYQ